MRNSKAGQLGVFSITLALECRSHRLQDDDPTLLMLNWLLKLMVENYSMDGVNPSHGLQVIFLETFL